MNWTDPANAARAARVAALLEEAEILERTAAGKVLEAQRVVNAMTDADRVGAHRLRNHLATLATMLKRLDAAVGNARGAVGGTDG